MGYVCELIKLLSFNDEFLSKGESNFNIKFFRYDIQAEQIEFFNNTSSIMELVGVYKKYDNTEIEVDVSKYDTTELYEFLSINSNLSLNFIESYDDTNVIFGFINEKYFIQDLINLLPFKTVKLQGKDEYNIDLTLVDLLTVLLIDPILEGGDEELYEPITTFDARYSSLTDTLIVESSITDKFKTFMNVIEKVDINKNYSIEIDDIFRNNGEIEDIYPILQPEIISSTDSFQKKIITRDNNLFNGDE